MSEKIELTVDEFSQGQRLDVFCAANLPELTRSHLQRLIAQGSVTLNGKQAKASKEVTEEDVVIVCPPEPVPLCIPAEPIPLDIVYEDADLLVVNKQQGLTVHPANGVYSGTLVNALLFRVKDLSGINGVLRPGIVHRLDKNTSGLMLVAKNDLAHRSLAEQIATKQCKRVYWALLEGILKSDAGMVDAPIARSPSDRKKMAVVEGGKQAVSLSRSEALCGVYAVRVRVENGPNASDSRACQVFRASCRGGRCLRIPKTKIQIERTIAAQQAYFLSPTHYGRVAFVRSPSAGLFRKSIEKFAVGLYNPVAKCYTELSKNS